MESDGIRWIHCGGIRGASWAEGPYTESLSAFQGLERHLARAGAGFDQVVRAWIYVNQITEGPDGKQRYQELNSARTDFFRNRNLCRRNRAPMASAAAYPASNGIGTQGSAITMCCMALDSDRPDVFVLPLENPQQTAACEYTANYSPQSPKFARAMAVVQGHYITTLVSGTASIVNQKTVHHGQAARQTEQTIENIAKLISPENFDRRLARRRGLFAGDREAASVRKAPRRLSGVPGCL